MNIWCFLFLCKFLRFAIDYSILNVIVVCLCLPRGGFGNFPLLAPFNFGRLLSKILKLLSVSCFLVCFYYILICNFIVGILFVVIDNVIITLFLLSVIHQHFLNNRTQLFSIHVGCWSYFFDLYISSCLKK